MAASQRNLLPKFPLVEQSNEIFIKEEVEMKDVECSNENQTELSEPDIKIEEDTLYSEGSVIKVEAKEYSCSLCSFSTKHKPSLHRHSKLHNPEQLPFYYCHLCDFRSIYLRNLHAHIKVLHQHKQTSNKLFKCDQCSYQCNYRENLTRHKKTHLTPDKRKSFVCNICNFETFYFKSYWVHLKMIHQICSGDELEVSEFKCYHCPFETKYRVNIVRHLKTHGKGLAMVYKCQDCNFQTIHKTNFNTHVLRHKNPEKIKMFQCQHCSHKTSYKASLRTHLKLHMSKDEVETYKCLACKFVTLYERSYKLHMLNIHNSNHPAIQEYKCSFCEFKSRYRENWQRHEKGHLQGGRQSSYSCLQCSFSTVQRGRYQKHLLVHSPHHEKVVVNKKSSKVLKSSQVNGTVIHGCDTCPFTTIHRASLRRHLETHLKPDDRKQFKCPTCMYRSYTRARVNSHVCPYRSQNE